VSKKDHKVAALMEGIEAGEHDPHLVGYLRCFNSQKFYEAHDVLEALWLKDRTGPDGDFFKGMIQFAGAFVHLQKSRNRPAKVLFLRCTTYLSKYPSKFYALDVAGIIKLAKYNASFLEKCEGEGEMLLKNIPELNLNENYTANKLAD
jgi:predicted metal-dependent hydrolase